MRLKQLIIQGFKSFAEKTVINFDGGIMAIVGPNGCGKSNIADAIRWVTGEKSAKSMRSSSMTDVIFSGAATKKPLNFCEVSIVLADVQGLLPVDFDEVAITRRLHRSGESEYFINRNPVRLKDIEELLAGSGIGKNSISIFEQGKIDQVIYLTPEERRTIFEETAGISRFIARKKDTLRNLKKTEENLSRVQDILVEVERQKTTCERQAQKATEFKEKKERLDFLDRGVLVTRWRELQGKSEKCIADLTETASSLEEKTKELEALQVAIHEGKLLLEEREGVLKRKRESFFEVRGQRDLKLEARRQSEEKMREAKEQETRLRKELTDLEERRVKWQEELKAKEHLAAELQNRLDVERLKLHEEKDVTKELEEKLKALRETHQLEQREELKRVQEESALEGQLKEARVRLEHLTFQEEKRKKRAGELALEKGELLRLQETKKRELEEEAASVLESKERLKEKDEALEALKASLKQLQMEETALIRSLSESEARLKVLLRLKEEMQGFSSGTKRLVSEAKRAGSPLFGKLKPLYEMQALSKEQHELFAPALRPYQQTLVALNEEAFLAALKMCKEEKLKEFSLLSLKSLGESSDQILERFLASVRVINSPDEAEVGFEYVTRDESFIDRRGVHFYPGKEHQNSFIREAEIKTLREEVKEKEARKKACEESLKEAEEKRGELQTERGECDKLLRKQEMKHVELNFACQRFLSDLEKLKREAEEMERQATSASQQIATLSQEAETVQTKLESAKERRTLAADRFQKSQEALKEVMSIHEEQLGKLKEQDQQFVRLSGDHQKTAYDANLLTMRLQEADSNREGVMRRLESCLHTFATAGGKGTSEDEELTELAAKLDRFEKAVHDEEGVVSQTKADLEVKEEALESLRTLEKELMEKKARLDVRQSEGQTTQEILKQELLERYQLLMEEVEDPNLENVKEAESELRRLRRAIEEMGPVNMAALEESQQHAERFNFLSEQVRDLNASKEELLKIITELDEESRRLFTETFAMVRENFRKNFAILFRGGEADLQLIGSEDVLEAGVEVIAKPPGKQMRSITLLSGGEKCMTALALLFAVFEVKPAPFCVLDEIDAPLDDTNISRFVEVLQQFTNDCQFVIITHNKRTMAIADALFGVSMPEKGVSKLLSIEFRKEAELPEPQLV